MTKSTTAAPPSLSGRRRRDTGALLLAAHRVDDPGERTLHLRLEDAQDRHDQDRGHHRHHDPPRHVTPVVPERRQPRGQKREQPHLSPPPHRASDVNVSSPGNSANSTVTGKIKKTTGTIMEISLRPPASSSARLPTSRTSTAWARSTSASGVPRSIATTSPCRKRVNDS